MKSFERKLELPLASWFQTLLAYLFGEMRVIVDSGWSMTTIKYRNILYVQEIKKVKPSKGEQ